MLEEDWLVKTENMTNLVRFNFYFDIFVFFLTKIILQQKDVKANIMSNFVII